MRALVAALLIAACAGVIRADTADPNTPAADANRPVDGGTEKVEVVGKRGTAGEAPTSFVTTIRPEDFAGRVVTLADLLGETPGVRVRRYGGVTGFATAMIRGSASNQTIVCVDGVPLNSPFGGAVNLADIPLAGLDAIEIHRGFAPASLGASSIGGVVNVRTRAPEDADRVTAAVSTGSFGTRTLSSLADWGTGPMRWAASAESETTKGNFHFLDNHGTEATTGDDRVRVRANNEAWSTALRLRGDVPLAGSRTLAVSTEWLRRRQGVPGIDAFQSEHGTFSLQRGLVRVGSDAPEPAAGGWSLGGSMDHAYTSESFADPIAGANPTPRDQTTRVEGTGATVTLIGRPSASQRISVLVEPRAQSASSIDRLNPAGEAIAARRASASAVVEDEIHLAAGRILVAPSLRYDLISDRSHGGAPGAPAAPAGDLSSTSGRLGGMLILSPRWSVRGNLGRFYRAPDLIERYGNEGTIAGNPALLPERGINGDIGVTFEGGSAGALDRVRLELTAFRTDADNLIQLNPLTSRVLKAFNTGQARITGIETSASLRLWKRLVASANYTHQRPIDHGDTPTAGGDLPGRPRDEANATESLTVGRATLFHRFAYVGANAIGPVAAITGNLPGPSASLTKLPSRYLHDAGVRVRASSRTEIALEVDNLLDRRVVDVARYPLPGRSLFLKIATSF
ncbi:MAG: TonB-dependent receptor [Acidobacteria bacterium]|nr:TonB-dependent receptor [Acidobacteriota bacterium]